MASASSGYHASDGAAYERFLGRWSERLAMMLADFADIADDGPLLDVGCGTGALAAEVAGRKSDRQVIGIDVSEPYLDFARKRHGAANLRFRRADATALPFADGEFVASLAQLVLNFVPDALGAAREMARVTRAGGVAAATVWDFCGGLVYQRLFWDTACAIDPTAGEVRDRLFSHSLAQPGGLARLWEAAGFAHPEMASLTIRMDYESFDDYWDPLLSGQGPVGVYVGGLGDTLRDDIKSRVRAAYLSGRADGPRSLTATAWAVRGIR